MGVRSRWVPAVLGTVFAISACFTGSSEEAEVARVVREWADSSSAAVAADFSNMLIAEFPVMGGAGAVTIQEEVRRVLAWSFSSPTEGDHTDQYEVVARAKARPTLAPPSMPTRSYDISAKYELIVDTRGRGVISYQLDLSQVSIKDRTAFEDEP